MIKQIKMFMYETKSKIGLVHAFLACIGAIILAYLSSMLLSTIISEDMAFKIIPAMIITPILSCIYGIWILFSKTRMEAVKKIFFTMLILLCSLIIILKVI